MDKVLQKMDILEQYPMKINETCPKHNIGKSPMAHKKENILCNPIYTENYLLNSTQFVITILSAN